MVNSKALPRGPHNGQRLDGSSCSSTDETVCVDERHMREEQATVLGETVGVCDGPAGSYVGISVRILCGDLMWGSQSWGILGAAMCNPGRGFSVLVRSPPAVRCINLQMT